MGCGCNSNNSINTSKVKLPPPKPTEAELHKYKTDIHLNILTQKRRKVAWAVCMLCPHQQELTSCGIDSQPLREKIGSDAGCPLGKHPDRFNRVRWPSGKWFKGWLWKGLPYHQQYVIAMPRFRKKFIGYGIPISAKRLMGCGCSVWLKGLWFNIVKVICPIGQKRSLIRQWPSVKLDNLLNRFYEYAKRS